MHPRNTGTAFPRPCNGCELYAEIVHVDVDAELYEFRSQMRRVERRRHRPTGVSVRALTSEDEHRCAKNNALQCSIASQHAPSHRGQDRFATGQRVGCFIRGCPQQLTIVQILRFFVTNRGLWVFVARLRLAPIARGEA